MVLVAVVVLSILLNPAGICVLLALLRFAPIFNRRFSFFDRLVFIAGIALRGNSNNGCIDNLTLLRDKSRLGKKRIELVKQLPRELVFLQFRTEEPDCLRIGNTAVKHHIQKTHKTQTIYNLIFHLVIAQIIDCRISIFNIRTTSNGPRQTLLLRSWLYMTSRSLRNFSHGTSFFSRRSMSPFSVR